MVSNRNPFSIRFTKIILFDVLIKLLFLIVPNFPSIKTDTNLFSAFAYLFLIEFVFFVLPYYLIAKIYMSIIKRVKNVFNKNIWILVFSVLFLFTPYLLVFLLFFRNEWPTSQVAFFLINGVLMGVVYSRLLGRADKVT